MRAAVYIRVSTEEQAKHGYSLVEQREACYARAKALGAENIEVFADDGVSGATLDRPGLDCLREQIRDGLVDMVIMRDPDRLARRLVYQLVLLDEFEKSKVQVIFLDFESENSPEGRLRSNLRGAIAEYEKEKIRDRMIRGKVQKAKQGGMPVNFDCYGYTYDPQIGEVSINEDEAKVVQLIFDMFLSEDCGIKGIAKLLNDHGFPTKRGARIWHRQVVRQMLLNARTYSGVFYYGRTKTTNQGELEETDPNIWIRINIPAIITQDTAAAALEKMERSRRLWAGKPKRKYLLSGLLRCGHCGGTMTGRYHKYPRSVSKFYTCQKSNPEVNPGCRPLRKMDAELLESAVWQELSSWLKDPERLIEEVRHLDKTGSQFEEGLAQVEQQLSSIEKSQENILKALANGWLDLDEKTENTLKDLKDKRSRLLHRLEQLKGRKNKTQDDTFDVSAIEQIAKHALRDLDNLSIDKKQGLIRGLVKNITVFQESNGWRISITTNITGSPEITVRPSSD